MCLTFPDTELYMRIYLPSFLTPINCFPYFISLFSITSAPFVIVLICFQWKHQICMFIISIWNMSTLCTYIWLRQKLVDSRFRKHHWLYTWGSSHIFITPELRRERKIAYITRRGRMQYRLEELFFICENNHCVFSVFKNYEHYHSIHVKNKITSCFRNTRHSWLCSQQKAIETYRQIQH